MTCDVSRRYRRSCVAVRNERQDEEAPGGGGPAGCAAAGWLSWWVPVTALLWALTAAVLYGTGAALQQRQAAAAPSQAAGRPRLLLLLARRPWWLLGIGVELGGFATHAVALRTGPLTIVQMLVASSLLFSVATVRLWSGRRLGWPAWAAVLAVIAGIASFVLLASPAGGAAGVPGASGQAGLAAAALAAGAVPLAAAGLAAAGRRRAVLLAVAAGLADAGIAVVTMAFSHVVSSGLTGMGGSWATYALMLGGPCSLLLTQTAYQAGRPMITLPVVAVVTPVASLIVGNLLLGESARLGVLSGAAAVLAVLVTAAGLVVLARLATGQGASRQSAVTCVPPAGSWPWYASPSSAARLPGGSRPAMPGAPPGENADAGPCLVRQR
jgi:drug/metabolite transporter (DMT)-like permease